MLCSAPTLPSSANWLDRLRSARGFPASDADDLDGAPLADANPNPNTVPAPPSGPVAVVSMPPSRGMHEIVTSILSDLFEMGETEREPVVENRRSSRKQPNPRFLPCLQDGVRASSLDSRWDERGKEGLEENVGVGEVGEEEGRGVGDGMEQGAAEGDEEEEEGLIGYSRSEVTIIDTSCEVWKFEKLVYRRKDVWKVRDRKGKGRGKMRKTKKRKLGGSESDVRGGMKRKVLKLSNEMPNSAKKDEKNHQNEMGVIGNIEAGPSFSELVARKRDTGGPSVALVKVMPVKIKKTRVFS
ncbi:hypothetical protein MLD38_015720 [Melastoma candidum]|uniref:Uncharacterized protein n=1 Tax=Melastoma candidum TaxID=119954 RepID=A0ACB9RGP3_9MYRT|nr:hypothetical protein MLD38_015720 [Melastoma candidum]